jgi:hypothetical protein
MEPKNLAKYINNELKKIYTRQLLRSISLGLPNKNTKKNTPKRSASK